MNLKNKERKDINNPQTPKSLHVKLHVGPLGHISCEVLGMNTAKLVHQNLFSPHNPKKNLCCFSEVLFVWFRYLT